MKSIDTLYNENYFRSRLEARWAVFFDAMGYPWEYEPEGFALDSGELYLPDFKIWNTYFEVKPDGAQAEQKHIDFIPPLFWLAGPPRPIQYALKHTNYNICNLKTFVFAFPLLLHEGQADNWHCYDGKTRTPFTDPLLHEGVPALIAACEIAQKVRFEHGQCPSKSEIIQAMENWK